MKKCIKYLFAFIFLVILIVPNKVSATSSSSEYTIESYDIDMIVNEDNTFDITEKITTDFHDSKHGIYRKIPLKNSVIRNDGTKSNNRAKISNLSVSENYKVSKESGYEVIKIGSKSQTYTGEHSYTIKYTYNIGKDPLKGADELYFNLIGNEWDTYISNVTFKITMPKSFDESLLGFSSGTTGSTNSSNVSYNVDGNTIMGSLQNILDAGQALTVRLTLPEDYFVGASSNIDMYSVAVIVICLICVLIAYRLWVKYGKNDRVIETVEFYPPEGYNSAEVGFLYKGSADTKSIISLLIYLADKGYLIIQETKNRLPNKDKEFIITKIKEYDGNNEYEKLFFKGLFKRSKKTSVKTSDLCNKFYTTLNKIEAKLNSKENKNKIFELSYSGKEKWLLMMSIAIWTLITVKPVLEYYAEEMLIFALTFAFLLPGICFSLLIFSLIRETKTPKIFSLFFGGYFGSMSWIASVLPTLIQNTMYFIMNIIGIICIAVIILLAKMIPKRTPYGNEILGKLKGFKRFLKTAEKPQLESLVAQNPEYFYNILPYTYALGVSNVWISQFETIALQAPNWYDSTDDFNMHTFGTFMTTTMASAATAMSSSYSEGSSYGGSSSGGSSFGGGGGGSSGGGSAGRGSGGGGGGSW